MTTLGFYVGNQPDEVYATERWLGRQVSAVLAFTGESDWGSCDPSWQIGGYLGKTGRRLNWSIPMFPKSGDNGGANFMREVANGQHYGRHQGWARACLAYRSGGTEDIYVRTAWELGGEWFPWTQAAASDREAFKKAFGQFAAAFKSVSPRFKLCWDFVPDRPNYGVENYYPGDGAVDLVTQDVYWHPQYDGNDPDAAFARHDTGLSRGLKWTADFARARGKGVAVPEWGVPGNSSLNGARFIQRMGAWLKDNRAVYADYWNGTSAYDGLLSDGSPTGTADELKKLVVQGISFGQPAPAPAPSPTPAPTPAPAPTPVEPASITVGTGARSLVLRVQQDAWQGDARYTVKVDGKQVGGELAAKATRASGKSDTVTVKGDWTPGAHTAEVTFLNDGWDGKTAGVNDRNLYVVEAALDGVAVPKSKLALLSNGPVGFAFTVPAAAPAPAPAPAPKPTPTPTPTPAPAPLPPEWGTAAFQAALLRKIADDLEAGRYVIA